jgi:phage/plasmid primase-like uncharacterized protein
MTDARSLTLSQGGKWFGRYGVAACPVCQPERRRDQDALTLAEAPDGRLLAHCKKAGCSFADLAAALGLTSGTYAPPDPLDAAKREAERRAEAVKKARQAVAVWNEAKPICGTIAEAYLRGRGVTCDLPETLRFHPACWHISAQRLPAMVAKVEGCDLPAVHRTYLLPDGSGQAKVDPPKAMLGAVNGGAVRLLDGAGPIMVAEGVETALSLASGLCAGPGAIWAALSTSGLRGLRLPATAGVLTVATDGDQPGQAAGNALAERAAAMGWRVFLLPAPAGFDWNDVLTGKAVAA